MADTPDIPTLEPTPELLRAAERCVWWQPAEVSLSNPPHLVAHIFTFGSTEDVIALQSQFRPIEESDETWDRSALRAALDAAPPGVFDARSWAWANLLAGRPDAPPMPVRSFA